MQTNKKSRTYTHSISTSIFVYGSSFRDFTINIQCFCEGIVALVFTKFGRPDLYKVTGHLLFLLLFPGAERTMLILLEWVNIAFLLSIKCTI